MFPDDCGKPHQHNEDDVKIKNSNDISRRVSRNLEVNKLFISYFIILLSRKVAYHAIYEEL